jgi:NAD(P)-dependent dehydrogenase (short-subunit alcohol dehydrogenase family)
MDSHRDPPTPRPAESGLVPGLDGPVHALVVGASRGIGAALAVALAARPEVAALYLAAREPERSPTLGALRQRHGERVQALACDVTDEASLAALRAAIEPRSPRLHLVLNAAGLLHGNGLGPEKSIRQVSAAGLRQAFAVNAFGPLMLAQALLPLLVHPESTVFASLSARVGSIGDNRLGGWYAYRASKAAQNQLLRTFAIELARLNRRSIVLALHPGTVDTALSRPFSANVDPGRLFTPERAAGALLQVIAARSAADSGRFFAWDGTEVPW